MTDISFIMITYNEDHNLEQVINNIKKITNKIFIVDSFSDDKSIQIINKYNINFIQKKFNNFSEQWNFAINKSPFKTTWVMKIDPDERISDKLVYEIKNKLDSNNYSAYNVDRFIWFMGQKFNIKQRNLRIWKYGLCKFSSDPVNEKPLVVGKIGNLSYALEHHDSPNIKHWLNKQNLYSSLESQFLFLNKDKKNHTNRGIIKNYFYTIPFRYTLLFLYHYVYLGSFKYGKKGYVWSYLRVLVYKLIEFKTYELYDVSKNK